ELAAPPATLGLAVATAPVEPPDLGPGVAELGGEPVSERAAHLPPQTPALVGRAAERPVHEDHDRPALRISHRRISPAGCADRAPRPRPAGVRETDAVRSGRGSPRLPGPACRRTPVESRDYLYIRRSSRCNSIRESAGRSGGRGAA